MDSDTASVDAAEPDASPNISFNKTPQGCVIFHIKTEMITIILLRFSFGCTICLLQS